MLLSENPLKIIGKAMVKKKEKRYKISYICNRGIIHYINNLNEAEAHIIEGALRKQWHTPLGVYSASNILVEQMED